MSNQGGHEMIAPLARRWDFLAGLMGQLGLKTFVEVGTHLGNTAAHILRTLPEARGITIDPWIVDPPVPEGKGEVVQREGLRMAHPDGPRMVEDRAIVSAASGIEGFTKDGAELVEKTFWENIGEHKDRVEHWRMTSTEAAKRAAGRLFDLVFIDALHDYDSTLADIDAWWPRVRAGGVLAGHDFNLKWHGVERAVAARFNLMSVGVGPDSVWFIVKPEEELDAAA